MHRAPVLCLTLVAALGASSLARAQDEVRATFALEPARVAPGATVELRADVALPEGWYVYASKETGGVSLEAAGLPAEGGLVEPQPTIKDDPYLGKKAVHKGTLRLVRRLKVPANAQAGSLEVSATLGFSACNEKQCYPPAERKATLRLEVAAPAAPEEPPPSEGEDPLGADPLGGIPGLPGAGEAPERVSIEASLSHPRVPPGALVEVRVDARPAEHWHFYGLSTPTGEPTRIALTGAEPVGKPSESPAPKVEEVEFVGTAHTFYGPARFTQLVRAPEAPGKHAIQGEVTWQACDPSTCVPGKQAFRLTREVAADAAPTGLSAPETTAPEAAPSPQASPQKPVAGAQEPPRGLAGLIGASFLLGLAMLLMPCTYPMIPITISVFSKGQQLSRAQTVVRAGAYALGIVLSFLAVGGVVQVLVGGQGQVAINAFATNAWVNLVIGVIFVYFAFSFFGYYELGLPAPLQRVMSSVGAARTASDGTVPLWSLFLMGLFFVLTSYTCGAPVVLGLFVTAATAPHPAAVLLATLVFACTVALPFFGLALVPNAMRLMPRSGSWFSVFKVVLGLVELGFAVKFFRGVDLQWGADWDILTRPVTLGLWTALAVMGAVYLLGRLPVKFPHDPPLRPVGRQRALWATVLLGVGGYFAYGLSGKPLAPAVEAFILAKVEQGDEKDTIRFTPDGQTYGTSLERFEAAKAKAGADGRAFVVFTGHNCSNCVQMEHAVLPHEEVKARLKDIPRVALFIDVGEEEAKHRNLMVQRYNTSGSIPAFVVIDGQGAVKSIQIGSCSPEEFLKFLAAGGIE